MSIHPTAFIGPNVELGARIVVGPFSVITGPCSIGDDVWIGSHVSIGSPAEIRGEPLFTFAEGGGGGIVIGSRTVLREFVTVNQGGGGATVIGEDCYIMDGAHVPHDADIGDGATVACAVLIGGHVHIGVGANLGLGAVFHQHTVVGAHAMVGMQATVTRPVPPFSIAYGSPARVSGVNRVGLERLGVDAELIDEWDGMLKVGAAAGRGGPPELAALLDEYESLLRG